MIGAEVKGLGAVNAFMACCIQGTTIIHYLKVMMRRLAVAVLILGTLVSGSLSVYAAESFIGYNTVSAKVYRQAVSFDTPTISFHGSTILPLPKVKEALGALVSWDTAAKTASLYRPEANMFFCDGVYFNGGSNPVKSTDAITFPKNTVIYNNWGSRAWSQSTYDKAAFVTAGDRGWKGKVYYRTVFEGADGIALLTIASSIELLGIGESFSAASTFMCLPTNTAGDCKALFQINIQRAMKQLNQERFMWNDFHAVLDVSLGGRMLIRLDASIS